MLNEIVIPLVSDATFFQMLSMAIHQLSAHLVAVQSDFVDTLCELSRTISDSARPASSVSKSFHPFSVTSNAGAVGVSSGIRGVRSLRNNLGDSEILTSINRATCTLGDRSSSCIQRPRFLRMWPRSNVAKDQWRRVNID